MKLQLHSSLIDGVDALDKSFTGGAPSYTFVPPVALCLSCCFNAVAVVRNPFARAYSFLKMYRRVSQAHFDELKFVHFLDQVTKAVCTAGSSRFTFQPEFGWTEILWEILVHLRPQVTKLRHLREQFVCDHDVVHLVHAETVPEDLESLGAA